MSKIFYKMIKHPLQALLIAPDEKMREKILSEDKTITIREGWRNYQKGYSVICCPIEPWCVGIEIIDVKHCLIKEVSSTEFNADGYESREHMIEDLQKYYPKIGLESKVTVINWDNVQGKLVDEFKRKDNEGKH